MKVPKSSICTGQECRYFGRSLADLIHFKVPKSHKLTGIESVADVQAEDHKRLASVQRALNDMKPGVRKLRTAKLAKKLSMPDTPATLASSRYYRDTRLTILPHLWKLTDETSHGSVRTVTILIKGWQYHPEELRHVKPKRLLERFRADLYRCGINEVDGFAFFALHGEYDEETDLFDIHIHGITVGEMDQVFERLSSRPKYRSYKIEKDGLKRRVHGVVRSDKPLTNMPAPLTYVMQSWWPARETYIKDGKVLRRRIRKRIPDVPHLHWLLWMDRWNISDMTLRMGMRMSKKRGLYTVKRRTRTDDESRLKGR